MNRTIASLLTGALLSAMGLAQSSADMQSGASVSQDASVSANKSGAAAGSNTSAAASQEAAVPGKSGRLAPASQLQSGSTVQAELIKSVDARKSKKGDEVVAKTTQDVKSNGQTVLPKGSKIVGQVTDVRAREKGQQESHMAIAFDHAILKNGTQVPMAFTLQAIGSSQTNAAMDDSRMAGSTMADENLSGTAAGAGTTGSGTSRGALSGVTSSSGRVLNTAGSTLHGVNSGGAGVAGSGVAGGLTSSSQGVIGIPGITLSSAASSTSAASATAGAGSVISSTTGNVHLDSGTRMILRSNGQ